MLCLVCYLGIRGGGIDKEIEIESGRERDI